MNSGHKNAIMMQLNNPHHQGSRPDMSEIERLLYLLTLPI